MRVADDARKLYLLVDIDDLLVYSSDKLQTIVNEKTNFKTEVLQMLEQLNRNCRYFVDEVTKACKKAQELHTKPNLKRFKIFDNYVCNDEQELYTKPIECAKYYLDLANLFLNQFLEERDTFLETDNMPKGQRRIFNYEKELASIIKYSEFIHNNQDAFHKINAFCLDQADLLIEITKKSNYGDSLTIPNYGALVSMDTNDIIKKGSLKEAVDRKQQEYILYEKPLQNIVNCIRLENRLHDIVTNAEVFYGSSMEIVDYSEIHSMKNVNWDAVALVESLIHSGIFAGVYFSTHHNGDREEKAKKILMKQILPEATGFIGQRFHSSEHDAERRSRSSKIDVATKELGVLPDQIVLFDDSAANCRDCKEKGGTEILYKPETDSEKMNGKIQETGFNRILRLDNNSVYGIIAQAYVKQANRGYQKRI